MSHRFSFFFFFVNSSESGNAIASMSSHKEGLSGSAASSHNVEGRGFRFARIVTLKSKRRDGEEVGS